MSGRMCVRTENSLQRMRLHGMTGDGPSGGKGIIRTNESLNEDGQMNK